MIRPPSTIAAAAAQIVSGQLSPVALVEECAARIERWEPELLAWTQLDLSAARHEAERLEALAKGGTIVGPLHGIPLGVKDIINVAGFDTRCGSPLREHALAQRDAPVMARLREAGAILLGKTATTQFAGFDPAPTRNPWSFSRTPGGSSSGSAAAVAAGMCFASLGTQTGGSITRPASYCGVAGFKPTFGAISVQGVVPLAPALDHVGCFARSAGDLALLWNVMRNDPAVTTTFDDRPLRFGVLRDYFFGDSLSAGVRHCTEISLERLAAAGLELKSIERLPESFGTVHALHRRIMAVEAAEYHRASFEQHPREYLPQISQLLREGLATNAADYTQALWLQHQFRRDMIELFNGHSVLLTPSTHVTAPNRETTGDPRFISPWSYAGFPTVTLPCGLADDGLPCGLQLIGLPGDDDYLLHAALRCEPHLPTLPWPTELK